MATVASVEFRDLSVRAQVLRLRASALAALADYPIVVARLRVINHGYNTTFRVDTTDGRRFALRLNVNSRKAPADLYAEMSWLAALAVDTDLSIPTPVRTRDGRLTTEVHDRTLGRTLPVAMFDWLSGPDLQRRAGPVQVHALGRTMAALHDHAERWSLPAGATLPHSDDVLFHGPNHLAALRPLLDPEERRLVDEAVDRVQPHFRHAGAGQRQLVLHGDLHLGNAKWYRGRLSVFDFDDCIIGVPVLDLAVSTYYLRPRAEMEAALRDGYASVRPLPEVDRERFEALVAGRNLLLLNELCGTETADFREALPTYVANSMLKLRHFMGTGVFRHDVVGVVPLP